MLKAGRRSQDFTMEYAMVSQCKQKGTYGVKREFCSGISYRAYFAGILYGNEARLA